MRTLPFLLLLSACVVGGGERIWEFDDVRGARVELENGDAEILSTTEDFLTVEWSGGGFGDGARPRVSCDDRGIVHIDADGGLLSGGDFIIRVPEGLRAGARIDRGSVMVDLASPADVFACVGMGDVDITLPGGRYDLHLDAGMGDLTVDGVTDDPDSPYTIDACVAAGSLAVTGW